MIDFSSNAVLVNCGYFAVGAIAIWIAGTKLEYYADGIAERTGLGRAFLGVVLLATATSLPEIATSVAATLSGNAELAVHNLLGGVIFQTAVLAAADVALGRRALTSTAPQFALLMAGVGLIFVLATALVGIAVSTDVQRSLSANQANVVVMAWAGALLASYVLMLLWTRRSQTHPRWQPMRMGEESHQASFTKSQSHQDRQHSSLRVLSVLFAVGSFVVLVGGWLVASTGEALATQTGLGSTFVGFTLVAIATSLPEISTTIAASRAGNYESAVANIYGSNAFDVSLLAPVAFLAGGEKMLEAMMSGSVGFAAALGIVVTALYLWGLLERRDRALWRLGWDSIAVVVLALFGSAVIFLMR